MSQHYDTTACRSLAAAAIAKSVADYKIAEGKGIVRQGKVVKGEFGKYAQGYQSGLTRCGNKRYASASIDIGTAINSETDVKVNLIFLRAGGGMDEWIDLAQLAVSGDAIRGKLGIIDSRTQSAGESSLAVEPSRKNR